MQKYVETEGHRVKIQYLKTLNTGKAFLEQLRNEDNKKFKEYCTDDQMEQLQEVLVAIVKRISYGD